MSGERVSSPSGKKKRRKKDLKIHDTATTSEGKEGEEDRKKALISLEKFEFTA